MRKDFHRQSAKIYMEKSKKIKQNWKTPEKFNVLFCISFDHYSQKLSSRWDIRHQSVSPLKFKILFPNFLRSLVLYHSAICAVTSMQSLL